MDFCPGTGERKVPAFHHHLLDLLRCQSQLYCTFRTDQLEGNKKSFVQILNFSLMGRYPTLFHIYFNESDILITELFDSNSPGTYFCKLGVHTHNLIQEITTIYVTEIIGYLELVKSL